MLKDLLTTVFEDILFIKLVSKEAKMFSMSKIFPRIGSGREGGIIAVSSTVSDGFTVFAIYFIKSMIDKCIQMLTIHGYRSGE